MKILIALPDNRYFLWQLLVQFNNFTKFGYDSDVIYVVGIFNETKSPELVKIMSDSRFKNKIFTYNDTRKNPKYHSSLRPHILSKYFEECGDTSGAYFYVDPDIVFTNYIDFSKLLNDDYWYLSDTRSYIDSKYIKSKSDELLYYMCNIVDINKKIVECNDDSAGGAQYLMKGISSKFWDKVYHDAESLFDYMVKTSNRYSPSSPIQAWTADMWAVLWNAWKFNHKTKIDSGLDFSWATDHISRWNECNIFHCAGVVDGKNSDYFYKGGYSNESPFKKNIKCSKDYCGFNYLKEIIDTENNFSEVIY